MPLAELPTITPDLPGTGGQIKVEPGHFVVEEAPLYEPAGEGEHLFVRLTRSGVTTRGVVNALARELGIPPHTIGYAGLKDRHARTTQVFSLPGVTAEEASRLVADLGYELAWAIPNPRKLKLGHLLGNSFTITVLEPEGEDALARASAIVAALRQRGLPNYFGAQRFGKFGSNAAQGLAVLTGQQRRPTAHWLHRLVVSAYQAELFNAYLALRIQRGWFDRILPGDLAKKTDTGGLFVVEETEIDQDRFQAGAITYTGPLFGHKMMQPAADAAALEAEVQQGSPVTIDQWRRNRIEGNRRPAYLHLPPIELEPHPHGFTLRFFLPKGAYATILLREIMKTPASAGIDLDEA